MENYALEKLVALRVNKEDLCDPRNMELDESIEEMIKEVEAKVKTH